jgi:membrane associated rhomboid family serine protease
MRNMPKPAFRHFNFKKEFGEIIRNVKAQDIILLLILPAVITLLMLLPDSFRMALQLHLKEPVWWQVFTSAYIHGSWAHLAGNLVGYFVAVLPAFIFAAYAGKKSLYYRMYLAICLGFPLIGGLAGLWAMPKYFPNVLTSSGASGIIAALFGIMPFIVVSYYSERSSIFSGNKFFWLVMGYAAFAFVEAYAFRKLFALEMIILLVIALLVFSYKSDFRILWIEIRKESKKNIFFCFLSFFLPLLFLATPFILFPAINKLVNNGAMTNFGIHYIGLLYGIFLAQIFHFGDKPQTGP